MMKKTIGQVVRSGLFSVSPSTLTADVLHLMRTKNISCVVVSVDEAPLGIFTERDTVRCISKKGMVFLDRPVEEVMSRDVRTVTADTLMYNAFTMLMTHKIRHLVVIDEAGRATGVVTQSDMIAHFGYEYFIKVKEISQIMSPKVMTIAQDNSLYRASQIMDKLSISFLVVMDEEEPVGVVSERDITREVSAGADIQRKSVKEVMKTPVVTVKPQTPAHDASWLMREHGIRRLVVVDDQDKVTGVVTQTDLIKGLESKYIETLKQIIREQSHELDKVIRDLSEKTLYLDSILSSSTGTGIMATDARFNVLYFNKAAEELIGIDVREALGRDVRKMKTELNLTVFPFERAIEAIQLGQTYSYSFEQVRKGGPIYLQVSMSGIFGRKDLLGLVIMIQDVTEQKRADETIRHMAYYDFLTDLPNRVLFRERFYLEVSRAKRSKMPIGLIVLDMDRFKDINDRLGHCTGDVLLKKVAGRLKKLLRETDTVARIGGDEFTIILPELKLSGDAVVVARRIIKKLEEPYQLEDQELEMSFSLGVALYPDHAQDMDELLKMADKAMYRAKALGRDTRGSHCVLCECQDT